MVQKTTNPSVTDRYDDDRPMSAEDDDVLHDDNRLNLTHLGVEMMIDSDMLRLEENSMRGISDGMIRNIMGTRPDASSKEATKEIPAVSTELWNILSSRL